MVYPEIIEPTSSVSSPVTCSLVLPLAVPTYGPGGTFSVIAKTRIAAPPSTVLSLIRDTSAWKEWNTFCPSCILKQPSARSRASTASSIIKEDAPQSGESMSHGPGWLEEGSTAVVDVYMNGDGLIEGRKRSRTTTIVITHLEAFSADLQPQETGREVPGEKKGYRIAWKSQGWANWQLHSERVMEFVEVENADGELGTEYVCWETFGGLLGVAVKATVGNQLVDRFGDYARDVKAFIEGRAA